tara:strand:+ start:1169 stop:1513 length:345 start_codon:yes stop_codon:yes gene_type:complete
MIKIEVGQVWECVHEGATHEEKVDTVSESGNIFWSLNRWGLPVMRSAKGLEEAGYTLQEKKIPADGVAVIVGEGPIKMIRISSGKLDEDGELLCYEDGEFSGTTIYWRKWEVYK